MGAAAHVVDVSEHGRHLSLDRGFLVVSATDASRKAATRFRNALLQIRLREAAVLGLHEEVPWPDGDDDE
jgi:hypothetical protein